MKRCNAMNVRTRLNSSGGGGFGPFKAWATLTQLVVVEKAGIVTELFNSLAHTRYVVGSSP